MSTRTLLWILLLICGCYLFLTLRQITYIAASPINGQGLFANKDIQSGDIVLDNVFPHKPSDKTLYKPVDKSTFNTYISTEGTKINHCSRTINSDLVTNDYKLYQLIAIKPIRQDDEIVSNYDSIHKRYPFIAASEPFYKEC